MGVQMYVSLSVGMWRAYQNQNTFTDLNEILQAHPHLSKEGLEQVSSRINSTGIVTTDWKSAFL